MLCTCVYTCVHLRVGVYACVHRSFLEKTAPQKMADSSEIREYKFYTCSIYTNGAFLFWCEGRRGTWVCDQQLFDPPDFISQLRRLYAEMVALTCPVENRLHCNMTVVLHSVK